MSTVCQRRGPREQAVGYRAVGYRAVGYGTYRIVDARTNEIVPVLLDDQVVGRTYGLDLDAVEKWLTREP